VFADVCRDLGIVPSHPLWRELSLVIIRHGGNLAALFKDTCQRLFQFPATNWPAAAPTASPAPLAPAAATGPAPNLAREPSGHENGASLWPAPPF
jgi:hypothetical protein